MKKLCHYFLLAVLLVGLPLGCCLVAGYDSVLADVAKIAPCCEDWPKDPTKLWILKCPFNWWIFWAMAIFTVVVMSPFVIRFTKVLISGHKTKVQRHPFPRFGWIGLVVLAVGWLFAWTRFEFVPPAIQRHTYEVLWAGFILVVNALCLKRSGRSPLTNHTKAYLISFPVSSLFWWFFEYLNRYVWNWFYIGIPGISATEYVIFATICFASVLPGVTAVAALLRTFPVFADEVYAGMAKVNIRSGVSVSVLATLTVLGLTGIVFFPQFAYPLLWISPLMGFIFVQVLLKERSSLDVLATGNWSIVFRFAVAALICGFVWETWNYYSLAKWVYNVPWVERWKVWEMPILGFAGYLPFGMECAAVAAWINPKLILNSDV